MARKQQLITFRLEGPEGAGKTLIIDLLAAIFSSTGLYMPIMPLTDRDPHAFQVAFGDPERAAIVNATAYFQQEAKAQREAADEDGY